ncbi:hypothetical protein FSP39_019408 [Pinctada imbricata]|uniref:FCH and double SH3 domains protein 2 n=1 Tax=Pinctada imbricata TaxID=66713 RepID=A0AA88Y914_PINIB|nr:hypothetical protein FSP39_019408 [Pinctada imbricata]
MQPPPRKVNHTKALKNIHSEQVSKLQTKLQQDCDLLEDIRNYSRQRSIIEKEYGQALLKLTSGLLKRDFQATPDLTSDDGEEHRTSMGVWRVILEETEKLAKSHLQAAEIYMEKIAEPVKPIKAAKLQCQKKLMPQLTTVQTEVNQTVLEMVKSHKVYSGDETIAHDARQKASDANEKLAKKSTGLFQSLASLQKNAAKLTSRKDMCEAKSVLSRNEYLLNMAAANAHQIQYFSHDIPEVLQTLDGDMYDKVSDYFSILSHTALDVSSQEKSAWENVVNQATMIDRQFNYKCFLYCNHVFTDLVQYHFQPCQNDECNHLSKDHGGGLQLDKEARKWATKIAKENKSLRDYNKTLKALECQLQGDGTSDSGISDTTSQEVELKIEEMKQHIRKAETAKMKAEYRIELLRTADVNVDEWLASAQAESLRAEEDEISRTPSQTSVRTESSGGVSKDVYNNSYNSGHNVTMTSKYPQRCRAIYDFQGSNQDELNMHENEELEIVADGDGDGWVRARNMDGQVGYIPQNYVDVIGDFTGGWDDNHDEQLADQIDSPNHNPIPTVEVHSPTSVSDMAQEVTSYSSGDMEVQMTTNEMYVDNQTPPTDGCWARAIYDYEACSEEELSFAEGTLIKILRKDENGVDDGFWEGEINGCIGVFPSLVVEELGLQSEEQITPEESSSPPQFVPPPPVTITAATPETELPPSAITNGTGKFTHVIFLNIK